MLLFSLFDWGVDEFVFELELLIEALRREVIHRGSRRLVGAFGRFLVILDRVVAS